MEGSVTVHMAAPADKIWNLVAEIRNTGRFSPEVFEAEWLDGADGPALGAKFRGHVRLNSALPVRVFWMFAGHLRGRRNVRDMRTTLERIKTVVEED
jgi:hypothetical protein